MIKNFNSQNFVDVSISKRFDGTNWVDTVNNYRFDGSNWIEYMTREINLYNLGDQCTSITGGWTRTTNFWYPYVGGSYENGNDYLKYNTDNMEIKSYMWYNYEVPMTVNSIDLTAYSRLNILFDFYCYETGTYNNGVNFGVSSGVPVYIYKNNPITVICDGYDYRQHESYRINYDKDETWYYDQSLSLDISTCSGLYYPWICPISWSWHNDYSIVKVKRIWLS